MTKLDVLRKLIREEVVAAIRSELPKMVSQIISEQKTQTGIGNVKKQFEKQKVPLTLNTVDTYSKKAQFTGLSETNPMFSMLNETAMSMQQDDVLSFTTDHVSPVMAFQPQEAQVGDVTSMLTTARPSSNLEAVQINEVPDFSGLMKKMIDQGVM